MLTEEQKRQIEQQNRTIADNMHSIKRRIVVFSGKGGIGKTTVSVNLAYGLQMNGNRAGILDARPEGRGLLSVNQSRILAAGGSS